MGSPAARYPYHLWANGEWHTATAGIDFYNTARSFRIGLNQGAKSRNKKVEYGDSTETTVTFRFVPRVFGCEHCGSTYERTHNAQKFCSTCVPDAKARTRMSVYGISEPEYQAMRAELNDGKCEICNLWQATVIDHNHNCTVGHRTNKGCSECTRGLLCNGCNLNIEPYESGLIDRDALPESAIAYLGKHDSLKRIIVTEGGKRPGLGSRRVRPTREVRAVSRILGKNTVEM